MRFYKSFNIADSLRECHNLLRYGKPQLAESICHKILTADPDNAEAYIVLGIAACQAGNLRQGIKLLKKSIELDPENPQPHNELGKAFTGLHRIADAHLSYRKAVALQPENDEFQLNLANILKKAGKYDEAVIHYQKAIAIRPDFAVLHNNLGNAYREAGDHVKAEASYRKAIAIEPSYAAAHNNLGNLLLENKRTNEAITSLQKATSLHPGYAIAHYNLGNALKFGGRLEEALASYRRSLSLDPRNSAAHSILLFLMNYFAHFSGKDIYRESLRWARQHADILLPARQVYTNSRDLGRKLRIGYVSPDFRTHSVAYFIEPVIQAHHRNNVAVYCYANVKKTDAATKRLQDEADYWRNIFGLSDAAVADRIRNDGIDILVDLAGHTPKNRLLVFARRPAPVQVTWLGYSNTTGMAAMDYRLTDAIADPVGAADSLHSEELIRLGHGFLCYQPDASAPDVGPSPFLEHDYVTFGSFNNIAKVTPVVIKVWAEILHRTPRSRLLIKSKPLADLDNRKRFLRLFEKSGISADRLELHGWLPTKEAHLGLYNSIDIGLDPFPYNGTTTTCEALWMGVPVVTLLGDRHSGRVGASIMHWAGLDELVAESPEEYQDLAISMANNCVRMQNLRKELRKQARQSRLMDRQHFIDTLEDTYRKIWAKWCVA